jgi:PAS domain S-box-containing protein
MHGKKKGHDDNQDISAGATEDIARKHRIEQVIGELGGGYWDLIESAPGIVQSVKPDGHFFYVNRAWREALGYSSEEAAELNFLDIIHPDYRDHCAAVFQEMMSGKRFEHIDCDFVAKDGRPVKVQGSVSCYFEKDKPIASRGFFKLVAKHGADEETSGDTPDELAGFKLEELFLEFHDLVDPGSAGPDSALRYSS